jgi:hypothetical protein
MLAVKIKSILPTLRYLLLVLLLLVAFAYGVHRYFEYRNTELDKKLQRLR